MPQRVFVSISLLAAFASPLVHAQSGCLDTDPSEPINWTLPSTPETPNWTLSSHGYTLSTDIVPQPEKVSFNATFWRRPECPTQLIMTLDLSGSVLLLGTWSGFQGGASAYFPDLIVNDPSHYGGHVLVFGPTTPPGTISGVVDFLGTSIDASQALTIDYTPQSLSGAESVVSIQIPAASAPPPFAIGPGITGNWYDAAESGHGFGIEVLPGNQMLAEWYVYDAQGHRDWILGTGPISGNTAVLQAIQGAGPGGRFPPNFDQNQVQTPAWGTLTFTFTDCNTGTASWQPSVTGYTAGSIPITRLTLPAGLACP